MTLPLIQLMGAQADRMFHSIGLNTNRIRYHGALIEPSPPIWHYGLQSTAEDTSVIQDSEPLQTYKSPIPIDSLTLALANKLTAVTEALDTLYGSGGLTLEEYEQQLADAQVLYTLGKALSAYSLWEISVNGGAWFDVYLKGEPDFRDVARYGCTFVVAGIAP